MMRFLTTLCFVATVAAAGGLYKVKIDARELAVEVRQLEREVAKTEETISMLKAEWSVLNEPRRIQRLAEEHLGLSAMTADQIMIVSSFDGDGERRMAQPTAQPTTLEDLLAQ